MKLLITGPLGHIGSKFIRHIKPGEYDQVVLLDNLFDPALLFSISIYRKVCHFNL